MTNRGRNKEEIGTCRLIKRRKEKTNMIHSKRRWWRFVALLVVLGVVVAACGNGDTTDTTADTTTTTAGSETTETTSAGPTDIAPEDRTELLLWTHAAGNPEEYGIIQQIMDDFTGSQDKWFVVHEAFPQGAYNDSVVAAALANNLPDILDVDGPLTPNWAWAGYLTPLNFGAEFEDRFVPGAKGVYQDEVYSIGFWDVTTGLFTRQSYLEDNGIRVPTIDDPWTLEEFDAALVALDATGDFDYAIDIGAAWTGEWAPYGYSPFLQSFGGDLIDRSNYLEAEGVLNGPEAVAFGEWFQSLFDRGLVAPGEADPDRDGYVNGTIAMQWDGIWRGKLSDDAFGDDAIFLPPPDLGNGPKAGVGSWQWAIASSSEHQDGAREYLEFSLQPKYVAEFAKQNGLVPAMEEALELVPDYASGGRFNVFYQWADQFGVIRPPTPAYLVISSEFEKAALDIADGADVQNALDAAVDAIEDDIEQNGGYGF
jgi:multiple sugar transport system substrate-binding protein